MIFVTGGTGFIGGYVLTELLTDPDQHLAVLTRARTPEEADAKLWRALQMHMSFDQFRQVRDRIHPIAGDLHAPGLGIGPEDHARVCAEARSVLHIAASLNRKSAKACLNSNLRGTLSVIKLAKQFAQLDRFSHVSTVAVAGHRANEVVYEDSAVDWERSDYDPYGRTKKFCEHMVRELLPDTKTTFFRPSIVLGDSRFPQTTQFDMLRAVCVLARMRVVPIDPGARVDIVNADFVGKCIARLHTTDAKHEIYHLSGGQQSLTASEVAGALISEGWPRNLFVPRLSRPFAKTVSAIDRIPTRHPIRLGAAVMKVFWPYVTWNVVFDNTRATEETGLTPASFADYGPALCRWAEDHRFRYPYTPLPQSPSGEDLKCA